MALTVNPNRCPQNHACPMIPHLPRKCNNSKSKRLARD